MNTSTPTQSQIESMLMLAEAFRDLDRMFPSVRYCRLWGEAVRGGVACRAVLRALGVDVEASAGWSVVGEDEIGFLYGADARSARDHLIPQSDAMLAMMRDITPAMADVADPRLWGKLIAGQVEAVREWAAIHPEATDSGEMPKSMVPVSGTFRADGDRLVFGTLTVFPPEDRDGWADAVAAATTGRLSGCLIRGHTPFAPVATMYQSEAERWIAAVVAHMKAQTTTAAPAPVLGRGEAAPGVTSVNGSEDEARVMRGQAVPEMQAALWEYAKANPYTSQRLVAEAIGKSAGPTFRRALDGSAMLARWERGEVRVIPADAVADWSTAASTRAVRKVATVDIAGEAMSPVRTRTPTTDDGAVEEVDREDSFAKYLASLPKHDLPQLKKDAESWNAERLEREKMIEQIINAQKPMTEDRTRERAALRERPTQEIEALHEATRDR